MTKQEAITILKCDATNLVGYASTETDKNKAKLIFDKVDAIDIAIECIEKCIYDEESPCTDCSQFGCRATNCIYSGRLE